MPAKETLWSGTSTYTNHCQALLHLTSLKASGHTWHKTRWNDGIFAHSNELRRESLYAAHTGMKDLMALGRVAPSPPSTCRARLSTSTGKWQQTSGLPRSSVNESRGTDAGHTLAEVMRSSKYGCRQPCTNPSRPDKQRKLEWSTSRIAVPIARRSIYPSTFLRTCAPMEEAHTRIRA